MSNNNLQRLRAFRKSREQHSSMTAEDYTQLILELIEEKGAARVTELARRLGITHVTALRTSRRLEKAGFLVTKRRAPLALTPKGRRLAEKVRSRNKVLVAFLKKLGVPPRIAEIDAEGIEHHVSNTTLSRIQAWLTKKG